MTKTHYDLLEIQAEAPIDQVREAATLQLQLWHPDKVSGLLKDRATARTVAILEARRVLTDPILRAEYDRSLLSRPPAAAQSVPFLCRIKHDWRLTPAVGAPHPCDMIRICRRCQQREEITSHDLGTEWYYYKEDSCALARQCKRCQEFVVKLDAAAVMMAVGAMMEKEVPHFKWGEWNETPGQCREVRRCERCGAEETRQLAHEFGQWQWVDPDDRCDQERQCANCDAVETRQRHDFSVSARDVETGRLQTQCRVCGLAQPG
jgi:DnaJ domain